jgi:predicted nucleic acid-binding Zn ribbon protein
MGDGRKNPKGVVHIQQVLDGVLQSCRPEAAAGLIDVWRLWDRTVGEVVAENTRPAAFKGRLLLVYAASSAWIHQLQFLKAELIEKLNAALGREMISDIKFKIGPVAKPGDGR